MKRPENDNWLDDVLGKTIGSEKPKADFEQWKQQHPDAVEMLTSKAGQDSSISQGPLSIRDIIMKNTFIKLATAAAIIIAVLLVLHFTGGPNITSVAWGNVAEKVEKIHSYIYRQRRNATSGPQKEGFEFIEPEWENIIYSSDEYGKRTDHYQNDELAFTQYILYNEEEIVMVMKSGKQYSRIPLPGAQHMASVDPREMVKHILQNDYEKLGFKTIDGIKAEGVELTGQKISGEKLDDAVTRLWVDVETDLPMRIELEGLAHNSSTQVLIVQDEFIWNVELQASDFEPNIPDDYALIEQEFPKPIPQQDELAFEEMSEASMDLPDLSGLTLLNLEKVTSETTKPLSGFMEVWKAQYEVMSKWPAYLDVKQELSQELQNKLDIANLSNEQLVANAIALREKFWAEGGRLSPTSYPYGYAAQILLETAREKNPENLTIVDELVETIQTIEPPFIFNKDPNEITAYLELRMRLKQIRAEQFEQIKQELEAGREPTWEDFVRVNDLAILCGDTTDLEQGINVAAWLIDNAEQGGWTAYLQPLRNMQDNFSKGNMFNYNIYNSRGTTFPEEYRYSGLPSFKGPRKRKVTPIHLLTEKPVWLGN